MAIEGPRKAGKQISGLRPIGDWIALIKKANSEFHNKLGQIYGENEDLKAEAARIVTRIMREGEAMQNDYDRVTGHGNLQGARFPF